jgi:hypothetical protein
MKNSEVVVPSSPAKKCNRCGVDFWWGKDAGRWRPFQADMKNLHLCRRALPMKEKPRSSGPLPGLIPVGKPVVTKQSKSDLRLRALRGAGLMGGWTGS